MANKEPLNVILKRFRQELGLSQAEASKGTGHSGTAVSGLETGDSQDFVFLIRILGVYGAVLYFADGVPITLENVKSKLAKERGDLDIKKVPELTGLGIQAVRDSENINKSYFTIETFFKLCLGYELSVYILRGKEEYLVDLEAAPNSSDD